MTYLQKRMLVRLGVILATVVVCGGILRPQSSYATANDGSCPIERLAGRIEFIQGAVNKIVILRGKAHIQAHVGGCILYGDSINASNVPELDVEIDTGRRRLGQLANDTAWNVPDPTSRPNETIWAALTDYYQAVVTPLHPRPVPGLSRDATCSDDTPALVPLGALPSVPAIPQVMGSDLTMIVAVWASKGERRNVHVTLSKPGGGIVAEASACALRYVKLDLSQNTLVQGDKLTLQVRDASGAELTWPIEVVAPDRLPQPANASAPAWQLAAWRLAVGDKQTALDSISRLLPASNGSFVARQILQSAISDAPP